MADLHQNLISDFVSRETEKKGVRAVFLVGSVARGNYHPGSDIDLHVVTKTPRDFESTFKEGIVMEVHRETLSQLEKNIDSSPMQLYSFIEAKSLYDPEGLVEELRERARSRLRAFKVSEEEFRKVRYWIDTTAQKIRSALDQKDYSKAGFYASTVLWKVVEGLYMKNNLPPPPVTPAFEKIKDLQDIPPKFKEIFKTACEGNTKERSLSTLALIEFILK